MANDDTEYVWIFHGEGARFAAATFRSREAAREWIVERRFSGTLTAYPLDESAYAWAVRNGRFTPKRDVQRAPEFEQGFTSAAQAHEHYIMGRLSGVIEHQTPTNVARSDWTLALANPQAIARLYRSTPELSEIHELTMQRDGPELRLRIELATYPDTPPTRWEKEFNCAQVVLCFRSIEQLEISGWCTNNLLTAYSVRKASAHVAFSFTGEHFAIVGECYAVEVESVLGHQSA